MKKGFYCLEDEDGYGFLESLSFDGETIDASYFLHGICHEFALALNKVFGYEIVLWTNWDYDINAEALVHAFNVIKKGDKVFYVDVRGVTDDLNNVINEFEYNEKLEEPWCMSLKEAKSYLKRIGVDTCISKDAYKVINEYSLYYQL